MPALAAQQFFQTLIENLNDVYAYWGLSEAAAREGIRGAPVRCAGRLVASASDAGTRELTHRCSNNHLVAESHELHQAVLRNSGFLAPSE